jgi:hypothetical protein
MGYLDSCTPYFIPNLSVAMSERIWVPWLLYSLLHPQFECIYEWEKLGTLILVLSVSSPITYSKGRCETSFHPSILSSIHPSVRSFICPVMVCLFWHGEERVEYRHDTRQRIIYVNVVILFYFLFFILGFLDLGTLILSLFQQLKELGWVFFFFFFKFYL